MTKILGAVATELLIAVPSDQKDLYVLHQKVWDQVSRSQAVQHRPTILYRRDHGMVRVRVTDCAMRGGLPSKVAFKQDECRSLSVRMALSRTGRTMRPDQALERARDLLERNGMKLVDCDIDCWTDRGIKKGMCIDLGIADVRGKVRIEQPELAASAWRNGIGRGKRFGFGMLVFMT